MAIVYKKHSVDIAGMVVTLLNPSTVITMNDESKLKKEVNVGLTQGGARRCSLTSAVQNIENVLIRRVLYALKIIDDREGPGPLLASLDDIVLLLASDISATIALRVA